MKPGRKLDALVAVKVMGWTDIETVKQSHLSYDAVQGVRPKTIASKHTGYKPKFMVPEYSTSVDAAWNIIDKLKDQFRNIAFSHLGNTVTVYSSTEGPLNFEKMLASGDTVPHAICLAAFKVLGIDVSELDK